MKTLLLSLALGGRYLGGLGLCRILEEEAEMSNYRELILFNYLSTL
jgi:hypothetical protein